MLSKIAQFLEFVAFVLEDVAERIDVDAAKKEANRQYKFLRSDLVDKV